MKKIVLAILDGIGVTSKEQGNAVFLAKTKTLDYLLSTYPHSILKASGESVGLPSGQMGNSEVGHITIGAGRIINQPLQIINNSIKDGSFYKNEELIKVIEHALKNNSKLHILGLLSDGGVHSSIDHIFELIKLAKEKGVRKLYIHAFLDGRDTLPNTAIKYLDMLSNYMKKEHIGEIATIMGRYYAMDREGMWDKTKKAYDAIVNNYGSYCNNYYDLIKRSYNNEEYDEFIEPTIINKAGIIEDGDGLIMANFRPDRIPQLFSAITNLSFNHFDTKKLNNIKLVTMFPVDASVICTNAFKHEKIVNSLGEVLEKNDLKSLRIAEASKYPHVTRFFDGDYETKYINTTKVKVSRKEVDTYDLYPKMSAIEVTDKIILDMKNYNFILVNYANGDMVGHTGNMNAAIEAVECVDECIAKLYAICKKNGYLLIITADHGNVEEMLDEKGNILTAHTTNPVNLIVCSNDYWVADGELSNIAPSVLNIMGIAIPKEMDKGIIIEELL